jgi:cell shape-determining protein MreD
VGIERRKTNEPFKGPERRGWLEEVEAWWILVARILSFFLGGVIFAVQALVSQEDFTEKLFWATIAVGLMWPVVGPGVMAALRTVRGNA